MPKRFWSARCGGSRFGAATLAAVLLILSCVSAEVRAQNAENPRPLSAIERRDASTTAMAVLRAYKALDLRSLFALATRRHRKLLMEIAERRDSHPRYRSIFKGWRWKAVQAWNGKLGQTRYVGGSPPRRARVVFHKMGKKLAVVTLRWEDGLWAFDDIHSPSEARFRKWGR